MRPSWRRIRDLARRACGLQRSSPPRPPRGRRAAPPSTSFRSPGEGRAWRGFPRHRSRPPARHRRCPSIVLLNISPLETRAVPHLRFAHGVDRGSTPTAAGVDDVPFEPVVRGLRIRRGGPRTPLPLLPVIAVAAGIGIAYVNQTAHVTTATYQATRLASQKQQLVAQNSQLNAELSRLESSERIIAAAQEMGMRPAAKWGFV